MQALRLFGIALGFLTRLPVQLKRPPTERELGASVALFPLAGVVVGLFSAAAGLAGRYLVEPGWRAPSGIAGGALGRGSIAAGAGAVLYILANILITGGLHLDGLSDVADGLAVSDPVRALEIMKDSHAGVMGVIWLILDILARFVLAQAVLLPGLVGWLVAAPSAGRAAQAIVISRYPYARNSGTGKAFSQNARAVHSMVAALFALGAGMCLGPAGPIVTIVSILVAWGWGKLLARWLGGLTGDTYGSINEVCELAFLFGAVILT